MAKQLKTNVIVGGTWYGPDYPQNKVTAEVLEQITNPAAFEGPTVGEPVNGDVTNVTAGASTEPGTPKQRASASEPAPAAPLGSGPEVPDGSVDEVLAWVGDDRDRAAQALEVEQAKDEDARKTLLEPLEDLLTR